MSDMSNLYKAYAAVHDDKARENLTDQRDEISEMTLTQLTDVDLYEIAEEIVEGLFAEGRGVSESEGLVQSTLAEAAAEGNESNVRIDKITRLEEAFVKAFAKVNEAAPVNAVETFMKYRDSKPLVEKWYDRVNHEHGNEKIHQSVVAEDRKVVLTGLEKMIDEMSEGADEEAKRRAREDRGRDLARKAEADAKKRGLKVTSEATYGGQSLAKREKDDDAFGSPNPKRKKYVVTKADERAGTEASKRYKAGNPAYTKESSELQEKKDKDTPDQVKAVIAYDRARHATDDATYDTLHGKKKQAKKEKDYAKWQRDRGARDAQKSGHPWEHEKYGTREKEGKKSVKHAHVKDSYESQGEVIAEKDLDASERRALPDSDFALPGKGKGPQGKQAGSYPIPDKTHARMALAMVAKHGTSAEKETVRAAVEKKFPGIKVSEEVQQLVNSERFSQEEILRLISD